MKRIWLIFILFFCAKAFAAEVIPPAPVNHFNDYANVVSSSTANRLNSQLEDFERQTSNQIVVAVFPKMQTDSSIEDYTHRMAEKWKPGLKGRNNGAILFVFIADHKLRIDTGYGLEGALPDALASQIINQEIVPHFKSGDYEGGLTAGINAMMAATRGEYQGTGQTFKESQQHRQLPIGFIFILVIIVLSFIYSGYQRATMYSRYGRRGSFWWPFFLGMLSSGGSSSSGGSWGGGGGGFGGGGGSFGGGGGSFGGGGASGSW